jgi:rhomboid family GlyGly-CTERM serine protease
VNRAESIRPSQCNRTDVWFQQLQYWFSEVWKHSGYTMVLAVVTIVIFAFPALTSSLQLNYDSVMSGQWWLVLSGHLTHYDGQHLFWDLLMFVVLGAICERQNKKLFGVLLVIMATIVSLTVMFACSDISEYRGLSGIDTGLFAWLTITQLRTSLAGRDRYFAAFWATSGLLLIGKLGFEMITGDVLFVQADGFKPILESHLAGTAVGALVALAIPTRGDES